MYDSAILEKRRFWHSYGRGWYLERWVPVLEPDFSKWGKAARVLLASALMSLVLCVVPAYADPSEVAIQTIVGEARGESLEGQIAVGEVIRNRFRANSWYGDSFEEVCLYPYQFSFWNSRSKARKVLWSIEPAVWQRAARAWEASRNSDLTKGATHYHAWGIGPLWTFDMKQTVRIGNHVFYREKK